MFVCLCVCVYVSVCSSNERFCKHLYHRFYNKKSPYEKGLGRNGKIFLGCSWGEAWAGR